MDRPWMKFHTRDWLDNKELRRCSRQAIATLADLMCLAHEGTPYGHLSDRAGALTEEFMASRCIVSLQQFRKDVKELLSSGRIEAKEDELIIPRMVKDEQTRLKRAAGGARSRGNPKLRDEGYPSMAVNGIPKLKIDSCARMRADSDSGSSLNIETSLLDNFDNPLYSRFNDLLAQWDHPDGVDDGARMWIVLVDSAEITSRSVDEVFDGLERYKASKKYVNGYRMRVDKWLSGRRWKDWPEPHGNGNGNGYHDTYSNG